MDTKINTSNSIISLIVPLRNCEHIIVSVLKGCIQQLEHYRKYEILLIDNYSDDNTVATLRELQKNYPCLRLLVLSKEYSTETLLTIGLDHCVGDHVVFFNALIDHPLIISHILDHLFQDYEVVSCEFSNPQLLLNNNTKCLFRFLPKKYKDIIFSDINFLYGFSRNAVNSLAKIKRKKKNFIYLEHYIGFKKKILSHELNPSSLKNLDRKTLRRSLLRLFDAAISHSERPLRIITFIGTMAAFLNLSFLVYIVIVTIIKDNIVEGWLTLAVMLGVMFFLLFSILTIIAEYLLKILSESHDEPLYFIKDEFDHSIFSSSDDKLNIV